MADTTEANNVTQTPRPSNIVFSMEEANELVKPTVLSEFAFLRKLNLT